MTSKSVFTSDEKGRVRRRSRPHSESRPSLAAKVMPAFQSVVLVLLLFGSLMPAGDYVQIGAAALALLLMAQAIVWPLVTRLYLHPVVPPVVVVFTALLLPALLIPSVGEYGQTKVGDLAFLSLVTALAASVVRDRAHMVVFARVWVIYSVIVSLITLAGGTGLSGRAVGVDDNPIGLARAIAIGLVAVVWLMINHRFRTIPGIAVIFLCGLGVFATGSKGPLLGTAIACAVLVLADSSKRGLRLVQMLLGAAALYLVVRFTPALANTRLGESILDPLGVEDPIRSSALTASFDALTAHGWQGHGYGSWSWVAAFPHMPYPHNIWVELLVEAGALSTLVVVGVVLFVMVRLVLNASPSAQLAAAWIATEAVSASLSGDIRARAFWFFLVLGFVVVRWGRETPPVKVASEIKGHPRQVPALPRY